MMKNKDITIARVLKILENEENGDTDYSEAIFEIEEGAEDKKIKKEIKNNNVRNKRRDWLILADIYNGGNYTQKFHLQNYLKFKLNDGYKETDNFYKTCYKHLRNAALILYINEVIFEENEENEELLKEKFNDVTNHYKNDKNKINNSKLAKDIRIAKVH